MMIFGGKLLVSQEPEVNDLDQVANPISALKFGLKSLSKQEKLLLVELQRTRTSIVNELSKIDPRAAGSSDNWLQVRQTMEGYQRKMGDDARGLYIPNPGRSGSPGRRSASIQAKKLAKHISGGKLGTSSSGAGGYYPTTTGGTTQGGTTQEKSSSSVIKLATYKTGVDMLPIMANTGDAALEVGLKLQGKLQLPVFSLPTLASDHYHRTKNEIEGKGVVVSYRKKLPSELRKGSSVTVSHRGQVYKTRVEFLRAIASMHLKMGKKELSMIKQHLHLNDRDIHHAEADILLELLLEEQRQEQEKRLREEREKNEVVRKRKLSVQLGNKYGWGVVDMEGFEEGEAPAQVQAIPLSETTLPSAPLTDPIPVAPAPLSLFMRSALLETLQRPGLGSRQKTGPGQGLADVSVSLSTVQSSTSVISTGLPTDITYINPTLQHKSSSQLGLADLSQQPVLMLKQLRSASAHHHHNSNNNHLQNTRVPQRPHSSSVVRFDIYDDAHGSGGVSSGGVTKPPPVRRSTLTTQPPTSSQSNHVMSSLSSTKLVASQNTPSLYPLSQGQSQIQLAKRPMSASVNAMHNAYGVPIGSGTRPKSSYKKPPSLAHPLSTRDQENIHPQLAHTRLLSGDKNKPGETFHEKIPLQLPTKPTAGSTLNSTLLKMELMQSLVTMQHHTEHVKDHIVNIKEVVDMDTNPKAKSFMLGMAAERMVTALWPCIRRELRRGWRAWIMAIRQEERKDILSRYVHFHEMRYLALAFKWLVYTAITKKWVQWVAFTKFETIRLQDTRQYAAAVVIQAIGRGMVTRLRLEHHRRMEKYGELYAACILVQAMFRGKPRRWQYKQWKRDEKRRKAATIIQKEIRRCLSTRRVNAYRHLLDQIYAITKINSLVRQFLAKIRVAAIRLHRLHVFSSITMERIVRGYLGRRKVAKILKELERFYAARLIQGQIRIYLAKCFLVKHRIAVHAYWRKRWASAGLIQRIYRGYRGRLKQKMFSYEITRKRRRAWNAATKIINMCRSYVARVKLSTLRSERFTRWVNQARNVREMWSEDAQDYFYYNESNGDSLWEPSRLGYTRHDGKLILENGECVIDPEILAQQGDVSMKMPKEMCSECNERYAIKACKECGDNYCTPCYRNAHATGTRKKHTFAKIGPVDCQECENFLAERWCVTCDEPHCDVCWRKLHTKGKRKFHPYYCIWPGGKIGTTMSTIDGREVAEGSYDPLFLQRQVDAELAGEAPAEADFNYTYPEDGAYGQEGYDYNNGATTEQPLLGYDADGNENNGYNDWQAGGTEGGDGAGATGGPVQGHWETAYDEEGTPYYYNVATGISTYDNPYTPLDPEVQDEKAQAMRDLLDQWAQAYDDENNVYWYNATTGVSQYENPFVTESGKEEEEEDPALANLPSNISQKSYQGEYEEY